MRTKTLFPVLTILVIAAMLFTACNLPGAANGLDQAQVDMAITMTLQALELHQLQTQVAQTEEAPTATPEPPVEEAEAEEEPAVEEAPAPTDTPEPEIIHSMVPGSFPAGRHSGVTDANSSAGAAQGRALAGEDFSRNLFERPFTSETMVYRPDLDIIRTTLNRGTDFIYVEIELSGQHEDGGLQGTYGFELDLDMDGRGDVLVLAANLQSDWSTDGVFAWEDTNNDVGGETPIIYDGVEGNGYNHLVFDEGKGNDADLVWARMSPSNPAAAQLAYKPALSDWTDEYLWWAVTDTMVKNPAWYDYNDHFTHEEAGSPLNGLAQYPLKQLAEIDNTCRWSVGFVPDGTEPGLCQIAVDPTPEPEEDEPEAQFGAIAGRVWIENNGNGAYDNPPDDPAIGKIVYIYPGACSGTHMNTTTNTSGSYSFGDLNVQQYCVVVENMGCQYQTPAQTVTVVAGETIIVNFYCEPVG
ncbi:MAG: SdrD B-like domain-containing protein [Anaerolineae bacterium]|jgi:hypothetical protein|nr:SdrD B-like domain-containing protein [Anaerolineae bacterium]